MWQRQKRLHTASVIVVRMACLAVVSVDSICAGPTSLIICALTLATTLPVLRMSGLHLTIPIVIELTFPWRVTNISADLFCQLWEGYISSVPRVFSFPES